MASRHSWHGRLPGSWALLNLVEHCGPLSLSHLKNISFLISSKNYLNPFLCLLSFGSTCPCHLVSLRFLVLFLSLFFPMCFNLDGLYHCVFRVSVGSLLHSQGPHARTPEDPLHDGACCGFNAYLYEAQLAKPSQERRTAYF